MKKLHEFLGLINFYRRFIPECAKIGQPLTDLSSTKVSKEKAFNIDDQSFKAFQEIKVALANATLLAHPSPDAPYCLTVDASNFAIGAVLQQHIDGIWKSVSFFSKRLKPAETRYSTFGRELLAVYLSIKYFPYCSEGREFYVLTDHKPLTYALSASPDKYSPREIRHLDFISQFTTDIRHIHGLKNVVADSLFRADINHLNSKSDFALLSQAQQEDPDLQKSQSSSSLDLKEFPLPLNSCTILCDTSTGKPRPYVPPAYRYIFLTNCISLLILGSVQPSHLSQNVLFGQV